MKVKALRTGYDGFQRQREGEIFDWPKDKKLGSWVEPVETGKEAEAAVTEVKKAQARADHAKLQREAIGQVIGTGGESADAGKK